MKRLILALALVSLLTIGAAPAWSKMVKVGTTRSGTWYLDPTPIRVEGDCRTVLYRLQYKNPKKTPYGMAAYRNAIIKICCQAKTVLFLSYTLLDSNNKPIHKEVLYPKIIKKPRKIRPGRTLDKVRQKVCPR